MQVEHDEVLRMCDDPASVNRERLSEYVRQVIRTERKLESALDAVDYYANQRNYNATAGTETIIGNAPVMQGDRGARARIALAEIKAIRLGTPPEKMDEVVNRMLVKSDAPIGDLSVKTDDAMKDLEKVIDALLSHEDIK